MNLNLSGKKVLITGGSKGLGRELVAGFLGEGSFVTYCARTAIRSPKISEMSIPQATHVFVDAMNGESIKQCVAESVRHMGGLDVLINNVGGVYESKNFWELSEEDWIGTYRLNVLSTVLFSRESIPILRKSEAPRIVNVSSINGVKPGFLNPHYSSAKASLINFTKYLAKALASDGILVNCVLPATFPSEGWDNFISQMAKERGMPVETVRMEEEAKASQGYPLKKIGRTTEIIPFVLLLASPNASGQTGSSFILDGGKTL